MCTLGRGPSEPCPCPRDGGNIQDSQQPPQQDGPVRSEHDMRGAVACAEKRRWGESSRRPAAAVRGGEDVMGLFGTSGRRKRSVGYCGSFRKAVTLGAGLALLAAGSTLALPAQTAAAAAPNYNGDPTQYWNGVLLEMFRQADGSQGSPGQLARSAAMMNAAIYDGESSYQNTFYTMTYKPYLSAPKYPNLGQGADEEERIIGRTAYNILHHLYPSQTAYLDKMFLDRFGTPSTQYDIIDTEIVSTIYNNMVRA